MKYKKNFYDNVHLFDWHHIQSIAINKTGNVIIDVEKSENGQKNWEINLISLIFAAISVAFLDQ